MTASNGSRADLIRIFFDSSVLYAGSGSRRGASYLLLQLAGLGLVEGVYSPEVEEEVKRNLTRKLPDALPAMTLLLDGLSRTQSPSDPALKPAAALAHPKDVAILAAAMESGCQFLVTLNPKDFWPPAEDIAIIRPGELVERVRASLSTGLK